MLVLSANKVQDSESLTRTFPDFLRFFALVLKIYNGFPKSIIGTHRAAIARKADCIMLCPGNMYSEQPSSILACLKSIILMKDIKTDGAHFELRGESA